MSQTTEVQVFDHTNTVVERTVSVEPAPASSVEITTDGKGQPKPTIKVYDEDPHEALAVALTLYRECMTRLHEPEPAADLETADDDTQVCLGTAASCPHCQKE